MGTVVANAVNAAQNMATDQQYSAAQDTANIVQNIVGNVPRVIDLGNEMRVEFPGGYRGASGM
jgi:hypothetical protein